MPRPYRTAVNPLPDQLDLGSSQLLPRIGRRHPGIGIAGDDPFEELALTTLPGHDRCVTGFKFGDRRLVLVQSQVGLAMGLIGAVAFETVFRQQRQNVATEIDLVIRRGNGAGRREDKQKRWKRFSNGHTKINYLEKERAKRVRVGPDTRDCPVSRESEVNLSRVPLAEA